MKTTLVNDRYQDSASVSLSAYDQYQREVGWIQETEPLEPEEEERLLQQVVRAARHPGNAHLQMVAKYARDRLVEGRQYLVRALARRVYRGFRGMEFLDLVNEGNIGLLKAIDRYPQCMDYAFGALATVCIRRAFWLAHYEGEQWSHIPDWMRKVRARVWNAQVQWEKVHHELPSVADLARDLGESEAHIEEILCLDAFERMESIEGLLREDDQEDHQMFTSLYAQAVLEEEEYQASLSKAFERELTAAQREVLEVRYGFGEGVGPRRSADMVADLLGVPVRGVYHCVESAERRLREVLAVGDNGRSVVYRPSFVSQQENYYDVKQAARVIGVTPRTLCNYVHQGIVSVDHVQKYGRGGRIAFFFLKQTVYDFVACRDEAVSA